MRRRHVMSDGRMSLGSIMWRVLSRAGPSLCWRTRPAARVQRDGACGGVGVLEGLEARDGEDLVKVVDERSLPRVRVVHRQSTEACNRMCEICSRDMLRRA